MSENWDKFEDGDKAGETTSFVFNDKTVVDNIEDFLAKIKEMDDKDLEPYVTGEKNDFAHWIRVCQKNDELADAIENAKTKDKLTSVIEYYLMTADPSQKGEDVEDDEQKSTYDKKDFKGKSDETVTEDKVRLFSTLLRKVKKEIGKVFIGQDETVDLVLLCLMCDAHALLEGVPGLAKTLLVETLTQAIGNTNFKRIQFLPDLLPSDIIGGQIYNPKTSTFKTIKGPIFANFVLADEINRAPPKTHAALMEAMQEKKINIDKDEFILDKPFLVIATQNPLENKGTYQLPEAVLDRFMLKIDLGYPKREDEKIIITENATTNKGKHKIKTVMTKEQFLTMQKQVKNVYISDRIKEYILDLTEATRGLNKNIEGIRFVQYGGGPRASIYLGIAAKARALMMGRNYVLPDDILFVAPSVLRHRVSLNFRGKAHGISSDKIVQEILMKVNAV